MSKALKINVCSKCKSTVRLHYMAGPRDGEVAGVFPHPDEPLEHPVAVICVACDCVGIKAGTPSIAVGLWNRHNPVETIADADGVIVSDDADVQAGVLIDQAIAESLPEVNEPPDAPDQFVLAFNELTTLHPTLEINADDPIGMVNEVIEYVLLTIEKWRVKAIEAADVGNQHRNSLDAAEITITSMQKMIDDLREHITQQHVVLTHRGDVIRSLNGDITKLRKMQFDASDDVAARKTRAKEYRDKIVMQQQIVDAKDAALETFAVELDRAKAATNDDDAATLRSLADQQSIVIKELDSRLTRLQSEQGGLIERAELAEKVVYTASYMLPISRDDALVASGQMQEFVHAVTAFHGNQDAEIVVMHDEADDKADDEAAPISCDDCEDTCFVSPLNVTKCGQAVTVTPLFRKRDCPKARGVK